MDEVVSKVPAKWKKIHIQLELTLSDKKKASLMPHQVIPISASLSCLMCGEITWSTVIKALQSPAVDEVWLAQELRTKLQS